MQQDQGAAVIEYPNVIWARKTLIAGGTLISIVIAVVVSLSVAKTFEVSRTLEVGQLPGNIRMQLPNDVQMGRLIERNLIEDRMTVIDRLRDQRRLTMLITELQLETTPEEISKAISVRGGRSRQTDPQIGYTVRAPSPELATRIADWLAESIITTHSRIFDMWMQITNEHEVELVRKIHSLEIEIYSMKKLLDGMMEARKVEAPMAMLFQTNIADGERSLVNLQGELKNLRLLRLEARNTTVVAADAPPQRPVQPTVGVNVALGGTLGLMVSTFLAFFLEYVEKAKRKG